MARTRNNYMQIVFKFLAEKGPFKLNMIDYSNADHTCQCCGKQNIHHLYHIENQKGEQFIVGSECQEWVLELTDAHLPASRVRTLSPDQLVVLGNKYGIELTIPAGPESIVRADMANQVIDARRRFANTAGWSSRRIQGKTKSVTA